MCMHMHRTACSRKSRSASDDVNKKRQQALKTLEKESGRDFSPISFRKSYNPLVDISVDIFEKEW